MFRLTAKLRGVWLLETSKNVFLEFFSPQSKTAMFTSRTFSITCCDRKWWDLPASPGYPGFSRG